MSTLHHGCPCHSRQVTMGRYHAFAEDQEDEGLDLDLRMMMFQPEEDVPPKSDDAEKTPVPAPGRASSSREYPSERDVAPLTQKDIQANEQEGLRQEKRSARG